MRQRAQNYLIFLSWNYLQQNTRSKYWKVSWIRVDQLFAWHHDSWLNIELAGGGCKQDSRSQARVPPSRVALAIIFSIQIIFYAPTSNCRLFTSFWSWKFRYFLLISLFPFLLPFSFEEAWRAVAHGACGVLNRPFIAGKFSLRAPAQVCTPVPPHCHSCTRTLEQPSTRTAAREVEARVFEARWRYCGRWRSGLWTTCSCANKLPAPQSVS